MLGMGERSAVFGSNAAIVRDYYGGHGVSFFYVRTDEEVGRVEVPDWVAADEGMLGLVHSLVVEQCRLGSRLPRRAERGARAGGRNGRGQAVLRGAGIGYA